MWPYLKYYLRIFLEGVSKLIKATYKIVGFPEEIRTRYLQNKIQQLDPTDGLLNNSVLDPEDYKYYDVKRNKE
jgi:hypothetical protein